MKKGDGMGMVLLGATLIAVLSIIVFAPRVDAPPVPFTPVEQTGSALAIGEGVTTASVPFAATLMVPGFVSLHEAMGSIPGPARAVSALLPAGEHTAAITPDSPLEPDVLYWALLIADDGDGVFEPGVDRPVLSGGASVRGRVVTPAL